MFDSSRNRRRCESRDLQEDRCWSSSKLTLFHFKSNFLLKRKQNMKMCRLGNQWLTVWQSAALQVTILCFSFPFQTSGCLKGWRSPSAQSATNPQIPPWGPKTRLDQTGINWVRMATAATCGTVSGYTVTSHCTSHHVTPSHHANVTIHCNVTSQPHVTSHNNTLYRCPVTVSQCPAVPSQCPTVESQHIFASLHL